LLDRSAGPRAASFGDAALDERGAEDEPTCQERADDEHCVEMPVPDEAADVHVDHGGAVLPGEPTAGAGRYEHAQQSEKDHEAQSARNPRRPCIRGRVAKNTAVCAWAACAVGRKPVMADFSTVGIWTECPNCTDEAVAVVQFRGRGDSRARLVDFRCPLRCDVDRHEVLHELRLTALDRAS
jgi:hypothetical protein